ncbi:unnamed protein product [Rotaria socialis]|uniref:Uncharacterized protein n=1 Tax=Rotaria socialis TaxID=392032 RepID=A0A818MPW7_9BILA|nr:unnamed protein product [Rotaria socialis]CAF3461654.1 unnamed protein product [Rotaria socialis]CAF3466030.1 unnamed protein product [Rotaria socialis]CAF3518700.1 unnamed protein product [Rotaria socialis]CAF3592589.1 unnamed protein product [Rotaria socialis]
MNIFTQIATQFLINKNTLTDLLKTLKFSTAFIEEFQNDHIFIDEDTIRQKIRILCDITQDESFQGLLCHDNGIQLVFHATPHDYRFMRFRISFDIKIIGIILNNQQQTLQFLISNIQIQSLNQLSKPFRFCVQCKARTLVIDELERLCAEKNISYERLFKNLKCPLVYRISLSNMKELNHLRERYLIIGNRSILDLIQITWVEHREQAIVLGYLLNTSLHGKKSYSYIQQVTMEKSSILL